MLLQLPRVTSFIGSESYKEYMSERFKDEVGILANFPAFRLEDANRFAALKKAHEGEKGLYFEPQPTFDEIARVLREWIPKLQFES